MATFSLIPSNEACDSCCGISGTPNCSCGGSGRMRDQLDFIRRSLLKEQRKYKALKDLFITLGDNGDKIWELLSRLEEVINQEADND